MTLRIGHGVDVHRLCAGRPLYLGTVEIAHDRGLEGHSDGDVAAHALCDALLGAAGLGTMGEHFPSSDGRWAGTSGRDFLRAVGALLAGAGATIISSQVVILAEEPTLAPHLTEMGLRMGGALGAEYGVVRVGATSTDGLGATGRGEGIAASAVALIESR